MRSESHLWSRWWKTCLLIVLFATSLYAEQVQRAVSGALEITARPGLDVVWEGTKVASIPASGRLTIGTIPPGRYRIELWQAGQVVLVQDIAIAPGQQQLSFQPPEPLETASPQPAPPSTAAPRPKPVSNNLDPQPSSTDLVASPETPTHSGTSEDGPAEERLSRRAVTSSRLPWAPLAILALILASLAAYTWRGQLLRARNSRRTIEYVPLDSRTALDPTVLREDHASFLEALNDRESAMESRLGRIAPHRNGIIDVDSRAVGDDEET